MITLNKPKLIIDNTDTIGTVKKKIREHIHKFSPKKQADISGNISILESNYNIDDLKYLLYPYFDIEIDTSSNSANILTSTLCWSCQNACSGLRCKWVDSLTPIPGWIADRNDIISTDRINKCLKSYVVYYCPDFIPDNDTDIPPGKKHVRLKRIQDGSGIKQYCPVCNTQIQLRPDQCPNCGSVFFSGYYYR